MLRRLITPLVFLTACSGSTETPDDAGTGADGGGGADAAVFDTGPLGPCVGWLLSYELSGEFDIRNTPFGAGDSTETVGPGRLVLLTEGDDDGPTPGTVALIEYRLEMMFDVQMIETDLVATAVAIDECGSAQGTLTASVARWTDEIAEYRTQGTITCRASDIVCGVAGLPKDMPQDVDRSHPLLPMNFSFTSSTGYGAWSMPYTEIPNDQPGDTFLRLEGVPLERRCIDRLPVCSR